MIQAGAKDASYNCKGHYVCALARFNLVAFAMSTTKRRPSVRKRFAPVFALASALRQRSFYRAPVRRAEHCKSVHT
jgi:hypothetical protein